MKRARMILTAAIVITVVGGAFAFKAVQQPEVFCGTTDNCNSVNFVLNDNQQPSTIDPCNDGSNQFHIASDCSDQLKSGTVFEKLPF
jgi:hypothetical protein